MNFTYHHRPPGPILLGDVRAGATGVVLGRATVAANALGLLKRRVFARVFS